MFFFFCKATGTPVFFKLQVTSAQGFKARFGPLLVFFVVYALCILVIHLWCYTCQPFDRHQPFASAKEQNILFQTFGDETVILANQLGKC